MPKNKLGGNKAKKGKNQIRENKDIVYREDGQEYGIITKVLGNCRMEVQCYDGVTRQCHIRGAMRKKVWISVNDTVLIALRDFQDDKADIIHKYSAEETRKLKNMGEIVEVKEIDKDGLVVEKDNDDCAFEFEDI